MVVNSLFPYFSKIKYTANGHTHWMVVPLGLESGGIPPGSSSDNYTFIANNGSEPDFETSMIGFVTMLLPFFKTTDSFILAELWGMATVDSDPVFYTAAILGLSGSSASANVPNSQAVMTLRTHLGGIIKITMMEGINAVNSRDDYPFAAVSNQNLGGYLISGPNIIRGRDGGKIISPLRYITKTNDALRKKYLLDG